MDTTHLRRTGASPALASAGLRRTINAAILAAVLGLVGIGLATGASTTAPREWTPVEWSAFSATYHGTFMVGANGFVQLVTK